MAAQDFISQASAYEKQGRATITHLLTKFRGYRCVKGRTPPTTLGMWWRAIIVPVVFFLLQCDVQTLIKLKLKQVSNEYYKEFHCKKIQERLAKMFFTFVSQFHRIRGDLKRL